MLWPAAAFDTGRFLKSTIYMQRIIHGSKPAAYQSSDKGVANTVRMRAKGLNKDVGLREPVMTPPDPKCKMGLTESPFPRKHWVSGEKAALPHPHLQTRAFTPNNFLSFCHPRWMATFLNPSGAPAQGISEIIGSSSTMSKWPDK